MVQPARSTPPPSPPTIPFPTLGEDAPPELTLRECYEKFLLPDLMDGAEGTRSEYRRAIGHFERRTDNPPVHLITNATIAALKQSFQADEYSPATINKTWRHLRAILRRCGPWGYRNPQGEGIIERVAYMKPLREPTKIPRLVTFDELGRLYNACDSVEWPGPKHLAAAMWRACIVLFFNYGQRTKDLIFLEWSAVDFESNTIRFIADKTHKLQGLPLNPVSRAHLDSIFSDERDRVFSFSRCQRDLYGYWAKIQEAAEISNAIEFRNLRETCASNYERISPGVGKWILGHAEQGVTDRYYMNPTPQVADAVQRLVQPSAFMRILD